MEEEIKIIDAERELIEITSPVKRVLSKVQLTRQKEILLSQLAKINKLLDKFP